MDDSLVVLTPAHANSKQWPDGERAVATAPDAPELSDDQADRDSGMRSRRRISRYAGPLLWVVRDALPRWKPEVAAVVFGNVLGLAAMIGAVGGVKQYARAAEHATPLHVLGWTIVLDQGVRTLLLFGAVIAGLGLLSATCMYFTDRLILSLAKRYHAACATRALAIAADPLCRGWQVTGDQSPRAIVLRMAGGASRVMGLMVRDLLRIILPGLTVVATIGFLFYIDATLTAILLPASLAYLVPLYLINRRVTRMQREYRERSVVARTDLSRRVRELLNSGEMASAAADLQREAIEGSAYRSALAALYGRLLADRRVHLLNAAFFIVCLVALLMFFGLQAREQGRPWSDLVFYLLALRYAMTSLKQTTAIGAKFSRFFPEFSAYAAFVAESNRTRERRRVVMASAMALPETLRLRLGKHAKWESPRALRLHTRGALVAFVPAVMGHAELEALLVRIEQRLDGDDDVSTRAAFIAQAEAIETDPSSSLSTLLVNGGLLKRPRVQSWLAQRLQKAGPWMVIAHNDPADIESLAAAMAPRELTCIVFDGMRIIAGGDQPWLMEHREQIAAFLAEQTDSAKVRAGDDADDDLDDEDDA